MLKKKKKNCLEISFRCLTVGFWLLKCTVKDVLSLRKSPPWNHSNLLYEQLFGNLLVPVFLPLARECED